MGKAMIFSVFVTLILGASLAATLAPGPKPAPTPEPASKKAEGNAKASPGGASAIPGMPDCGSDYVKPSDAELKGRLSPLQYAVTQQEGTERAFANPYWDNHRAGIYVDVVSGEPLFSSNEKYDSGTGWPSFWKALEESNVKKGSEVAFIAPYAEVRSTHGDSHLGHVFHDGPQPTGLRYCINSASIRFIPVEDLEKEGYGRYCSLFEKEPVEKKAAPKKPGE